MSTHYYVSFVGIDYQMKMEIFESITEAQDLVTFLMKDSNCASVTFGLVYRVPEFKLSLEKFKREKRISGFTSPSTGL